MVGEGGGVASSWMRRLAGSHEAPVVTILPAVAILHPVRLAVKTIGELCGPIRARGDSVVGACEVGCTVGENSFAAAKRDSFNAFAQR